MSDKFELPEITFKCPACACQNRAHVLTAATAYVVGASQALLYPRSVRRQLCATHQAMLDEMAEMLKEKEKR